jgi:hypothetical protein
VSGNSLRLQLMRDIEVPLGTLLHWWPAPYLPLSRPSPLQEIRAAQQRPVLMGMNACEAWLLKL